MGEGEGEAGEVRQTQLNRGTMATNGVQPVTEDSQAMESGDICIRMQHEGVPVILDVYMDGRLFYSSTGCPCPNCSSSASDTKSTST
jgi:hypothetical protein